MKGPVNGSNLFGRSFAAAAAAAAVGCLGVVGVWSAQRPKPPSVGVPEGHQTTQPNDRTALKARRWREWGKLKHG